MGAWNGRRSEWNTLQRALAAAVLHGVCAHGDVFVPWMPVKLFSPSSRKITYRQSLLRRTSAGELKEITDCDTSFSWKCYVNVFFLTRRGTPLVSHNKKPAKRSQPSVNQVLWWFCTWILWSSPRPMHPVSWLEASWFWCGEKGEGPPNNASFYS